MKSGTPRVLRTLNEGAVIDALFEHGAMTRPEIEARTGLSKPAAARLLLRVEAAGVIERAGERPSRSGPPAAVWRVNPRAALVAGVTVRAGLLTAEVCDLQGETIGVAESDRTVVDAAAAVDAVHDVVARAVGDIAQLDEVRDIAIGLPGTIDPDTGILRYARSLDPWVGIDLIGLVGERFAGATVQTANDVALTLTAETAYGSAQQSSSVALLWVGSGTRVAYARDGVLMLGPHGAAGEIGTIVAPAFGGEADRSTPRGQAVPGGGMLVEQLLGPASIDAIGDDAAETAARIAAVLSSVIALLDPELVVLAGSVADAGGATLASAVEDALAYLPHERPHVVCAELGARAQVRGAVHLAQLSARARLVDAGSMADVVLPDPAR